MAKASAARKQPNFLVRYARETTAELRKVTWPTRQEATRLTIMVLIVVALSSMLLGVLDLLFARLISLVLALG